ncbi:MAG: SUMF1/EgtB/PvdO family nonheme iron enzyme [Nodosilinea sp.]
MTDARSIFISYRRRDSVDITGRIHDRLIAHFGTDSIFKDVDAIPFGADFRKHLEREVSNCPVLLAIIGPTWLTVGDAKGNRRLDSQADWVRVEIEAALNRDSLVIPVLVGGAELPKDSALPESLKGLAYRQSALVRPDPDFHRDMDRLIQRIEGVFSGLVLPSGSATLVPAYPAQSSTYPASDSALPYTNLIDDLATALTAATEASKSTTARTVTRRRWLKLAGLGLVGGSSAFALRRLWPTLQTLPIEVPKSLPDLAALSDQLEEALSAPSPPPSVETQPPVAATPAPEPAPDYTYETVGVDEFGLSLYEAKFSTDAYAELILETADGSVPLPLVTITGGPFLFGAPDTEPGHEATQPAQTIATVGSFWMGIYPVTQRQWRAVAQLPPVNQPLNPIPAYFGGGDRPVEQVSWEDAVEFCDRLSRHTGQRYRLPTETEWEYACRAKTTTPFHTGRTLTTDLANYDGTRPYQSEAPGQFRAETTVVGSFAKANEFGLYDMHGNVLEWCSDRWSAGNIDGATDDEPPSPPAEAEVAEQRVIRGGSWQSLPHQCRSAYRTGLGVATRNREVGFRIVRDMMNTTGDLAL